MVLPTAKSVAARYYAQLLDVNTGIRVAYFDRWISLKYTKYLNGVDTHEFVIDGTDSKRNKFELDYILEVYRSIPGCGVDWYCDYRGFHRTPTRFQEKSPTYTSIGVGMNELLLRRIINYRKGTIQSDKYNVSETAMKEYVEENCGPSATIANGRISDGVMPRFKVEATSGAGLIWGDNKGFENLLDVLREISLYSGIDFAVEYHNPHTSGLAYDYLFKTYVGQYGEDKTTIGLDTHTGLNAAGNTPVKFIIGSGNLQQVSYTMDRISEATVVTVLGQGDKSTQTVVAVENVVDSGDSPLNKREIARSATDCEFTYQLIAVGAYELKNAGKKEGFSFIPLQQSTCLYGRHYNLGDKVTAVHDGITAHKRITSVSITSAQAKDDLSIEFSDLV